VHAMRSGSLLCRVCHIAVGDDGRKMRPRHCISAWAGELRRVPAWHILQRHSQSGAMYGMRCGKVLSGKLDRGKAVQSGHSSKCAFRGFGAGLFPLHDGLFFQRPCNVHLQ
jgi:hypothetical protein